MSEKLLFPEYVVKLTREEAELVLVDVHSRLASLLAYLDHRQRLLAGGPEGWLRRRVNLLRNLAAKLEALTGEGKEEKAF